MVDYEVIESVLQCLALLRADSAFQKFDFESMSEEDEKLKPLEKTWLLQKLLIIKKIAELCGDAEMLEKIKEVSFHADAMRSIFGLLTQFVETRVAELKVKKFCDSDFMDFCGCDIYTLNEILKSLLINVGTLTENFESGKFEHSYNRAIQSEWVKRSILEMVKAAEMYECATDEELLYSFKRGLASIISQFIKKVRASNSVGTPFDSLEYLLFRCDLEDYSRSYCWIEDVVFESSFLPQMMRHLEKNGEEWAGKLIRELDRIDGICDSIYLNSINSQILRSENVWYFPVFVCELMEGRSMFETELYNFNVDNIFRIIGMAMVYRYLIREHVFENEGKVCFRKEN